VARSEVQRDHLMKEMGRAIGELDAFLFTTLEQVTMGNVLTILIWQRADRDERLALFVV
jgi:hypothetical protein